ncbi:MAG: hypothetical protein ACRD4O_02790, partial [Bryobacteraceae bacterium]
LVLLLLAASLPALVAAQNGNSNQTDPFVGTWNLNVARSHFKPGPAPTSGTVTIASDRVSVHTVTNTQNGEKTADWSYTPGSEGQPAQITGTGGMQNCTVTSKKVNDRTVEHTWNCNGQVLHGRGMVAKNGKTMRYTMTGTGSNGKRVHNVEVYTKEGS